MLAGVEARNCLGLVLVARRAQNDGIDRRITKRIVESRGMTVVAVFSGKRLRALWHPADEPPQVMPVCPKGPAVAQRRHAVANDGEG